MDTISILIITKGHNSVNIAYVVTILSFCTSSNHSLHLFQVSRIYLERFQSYGVDTISILIITKGHNSVNIAHGVTVLILHLYRVSRKYLERFQL